MTMLKNKTKISILSFALLSIILFGILSTSVGASGTYQLTLVKGTEEFIVERYNDADWKITVDPSLTPSDWFEGEANVTNAKSKITLKGWTPNTWDTYDVLTSIFMPEYFSFGEILELLIIMDLQGYNETAININYNYNYSLWYGLRAVWNYTDNDFEEKPSYNDGVIILQNPLEFKTMLNDYNTLAAELNGNIAIILSGYSFPIISADDFLWQLALNGLAIAEPQNNYLESMVNELGCENVSVIGSSIVIQRYGLTNYTVEISYGEEGMMSSFTVKDIDDSIIYQIKSSNSDLIFYLILIIVAISAVTIVTFLMIRKKKLHR